MGLSTDQLVRMSRPLEEAIDLDELGRQKWLEGLSPENQDLKEALRQGLLVPRELEPLSEQARAAAFLPSDASGLKVGDRVGPYLLTRELGHGGMAQVWLAARVDGVLKREVALKVPALNILRQDLAQRFALERDILAGLEHPNIARLYDAGVTAEGLPYLAMEYVRGKSLGAWADEQRLGVNSRIELFLQVLEAVQYAHDRGVLHRDIKPSNVLVTDKGQVRLLDFGVAKLLQTGEAGLTQVYGRAFTPEYASPEQILGEPLQERSDVYSLGAMLYELLVGSPPYRISAGDSAGFIEKTAHRAPIERPSTQVGAEAATVRATTPKKLARHLRGDLDAIVLKCLAKAPADRYASAAALAEDLQRYLAAEPVQARPGTPTYHLTKFVLRHPIGLATVTGMTILFAATIGYEAIRSGSGLNIAQPGSNMASAVQGALATRDKSIAVLPFVDMSEHHDQEYFSDGLSEELIERLARSPDLKVIARTSSFYFKGKQATIGEIAKTLKVSNFLEGSVRKSGHTMRVTVQLIRASDGTPLWSQTYDKTPDDIFKVQDDIASIVVTALKSAMSGTLTAQRSTGNVEAYNLLLRGNYFAERKTKADARRALEFYQKAIDLDPNYAVAWAKMAKMYETQAVIGWIRPNDVIGKIRAAAEHAAQLDPQLLLAQVYLGELSEQFDWDWKAARDHFARASQLDPENDIAASDLAHLNGRMFGQWDEDIAIKRRIVDRNPLDLAELNALSIDLFFAGRFSEAAAVANQLVLLSPTFAGAYTDLAEPLLYLGRLDDALAAAQKEADESWKLATLPLVYWALGRRGESDATLQQFESKYADVGAYNIAEIYAYRGQADAAFSWLERAYRQRDSGMSAVRGDPLLQNLRKDPRFMAVLAKMKLDRDSLTTSR